MIRNLRLFGVGPTNLPNLENSETILYNIQQEAGGLYDAQHAELIRNLCSSLLTHSMQNDIFSSGDSAHGEIRNGLKTPFHETIFEHLSHLRFFESRAIKRPLKILDLACGNGDFTYLARRKGHICIATEVTDAKLQNLNSWAPLKSRQDVLSARRTFSREILHVEFENCKILWNQPLNLQERDFDVIYINQATIHYPGSGTEHYWNNKNWQRFLLNLLPLLQEDGFIFITLADPSYMQLSNYLLQFYKEYSENLTVINPTHWWTLLFIHKQQWPLIQNLDPFPEDTESHYFADFGRSRRDLISHRLLRRSSS